MITEKRSVIENLCLTMGIWLFWSGTAYAAGFDIYYYRSDNGAQMITNHPHERSGYRLIKVYSKSQGWLQMDGEQDIESEPEPLPGLDDLIDYAASAVSLDPLLIKSVMHAESAFDPNAVSHKGASGLMQLMPATARRYGVMRIFDSRENVLGGARYLKDLLDQFDGNLELALAAYNAGENAVREYQGIPEYEETQRYVERVKDLYRRYKASHRGQD
jgi:soluble lytic murein transglycosylase-like protein